MRIFIVGSYQGMKMKKLIVYLIFQMVILVGNSQSINVEVVIFDAENNEVVPYSTLEIKGKGGTVCDETGFCSFLIDDEDLGDTVQISNVSYVNQSICLNELLSQDTIFLHPKNYEIEPVLVQAHSPTGVKESGILRQTADASYSMSTWMQVGVHIAGNNRSDEWLTSVSFYISRSKQNAPFRIRIYNTLKDGKPNEDLLQTSKIVYAPKSGWIKVDLLEEKIKIPEHGVFVAMEWLNSGRKYSYKRKILETVQRAYWPDLGSVIDSKIPITWIKRIGSEWQKDERSFGGNSFRNAMIKIESEGRK